MQEGRGGWGSLTAEAAASTSALLYQEETQTERVWERKRQNRTRLTVQEHRISDPVLHTEHVWKFCGQITVGAHSSVSFIAKNIEEGEMLPRVFLEQLNNEQLNSKMWLLFFYTFKSLVLKETQCGPLKWSLYYIINPPTCTNVPCDERGKKYYLDFVATYWPYLFRITYWMRVACFHFLIFFKQRA